MFWNSLLFSFSLPGAKWVDNNQKLTCQCCAPVGAWKNTNMKPPPPPPPPPASLCLILFLLDCLLKRFRYLIHKYWHVFQIPFLHFMYFFLIIYATLFAKFFLVLIYFSLLLKARSWIWVTFKWFIFSFLNSGIWASFYNWEASKYISLFLFKSHHIYLFFSFFFKSIGL